MVSGLLIIYSFTILHMQGQQLQSTQRSANYAETIQAKNMAQSGLEMSLQKLKNNPNWRNDGNPWNVKMGYGSADIQIVDPTTDNTLKYNQLKIASTGDVNGGKKQVVAVVSNQLESPSAAMAFYGNNNVNFSANGNAFQINGNNSDLYGKNTGGIHLPGVAVGGSNAHDTFVSGLSHQQEDNIIGSGGTPSIKTDPALDPSDITQKVENWKQYRDRTISGGKWNNVYWGSKNNPEITVIEGDTEVKGSGFGMLIVESGADLTVFGNFEFKGLVIEEGSSLGLKGHGNPDILGSVLMIPNCKDAGNGGSGSGSSTGNGNGNSNGNGNGNGKASLMKNELSVDRAMVFSAVEDAWNYFFTVESNTSSPSSSNNQNSNSGGCNIQVSFSGKVSVRFSNDVLYHLQQGMAKKMDFKYNIERIYE